MQQVAIGSRRDVSCGFQTFRHFQRNRFDGTLRLVLEENVRLKRRREEVILGDCMEHLEQISSNSVDLVITDPPYGLPESTKISRKHGNKFGAAGDIDTTFEWDERSQLCWARECLRILRPGGVFISFYEREHLQDLTEYASACGAIVRDIGAWHKTNPVPQVRKVKWASALELFAILIKTGERHTFNWELGYQHNVIVAPICSGHERTAHPTQKPLTVISRMIAYWSRPGDLIVDPFAGSGTAAVAAKVLGRDFVVFERDPKYHGLILKRLADAENHSSLAIARCFQHVTPAGMASRRLSKRRRTSCEKGDACERPQLRGTVADLHAKRS